MTPRFELDRATARRFLVTRHLLAPPRGLPPDPGSVLRVVERLGSLQFDPLAVTGRNHDLVLAARIAGYRRAWTDEHLYGSRMLYETYNKGLSIVPTRELPWYRITWDLNRDEHAGAAFDVHAPLVEELLDRIRRDGPLSSTDLEPRAAIDWYWRPTNQVRAILEGYAVKLAVEACTAADVNKIMDLIEEIRAAARRGETDEVVRLDFEIHEFFVDLSGNSFLIQIWSTIKIHVRRALSMRHHSYPDLIDIADSHLPFCQLIQTRNSAEAGRTMELHITDALRDLLERWGVNERQIGLQPDEK